MKSKRTTKDCKIFLANEIKKNPVIIHEIFADKTTAIDDAIKPDSWMRESKLKPTGNHDYAQKRYSARDLDHSIPASELAAVRVMSLRDYEGAIRFSILEGLNGELYLGEYLGD